MSADVRVLRRFQAPLQYENSAVAAGLLKVGLYVDVETTGLDTARDEIIEVAFLPFEYDAEGRVFEVGYGRSYFNDPGRPIPPDVVALTGISDAMVRGQRIDDARVLAAVHDVELVVAHNAEFDRRIIERRLPVFSSKAWACSYREVPWDRFGCACSKLAHILVDACGEFYEAHRALDDCRVGLHVLATAQCGGRTAFSYLLESSRQPTLRVWANGAPYQLKDVLKARQYRWCDGTTGRFKAWYRDVPASDLEAERAWLQDNCRIGLPFIGRFDATARYSVRCDR